MEPLQKQGFFDFLMTFMRDIFCARLFSFCARLPYFCARLIFFCARLPYFCARLFPFMHNFLFAHHFLTFAHDFSTFPAPIPTDYSPPHSYSTQKTRQINVQFAALFLFYLPSNQSIRKLEMVFLSFPACSCSPVTSSSTFCMTAACSFVAADTSKEPADVSSAMADTS